jgi:DNA polymerase IV
MSDTHTERDSPSPAEEDEQVALDLSALPLTFVISTHMQPATLRSLEDALLSHGAPLTYDAKEARLFLCSLHTKRRAGVELRSVGVWTEELPEAEQLSHAPGKRAGDAGGSSVARRRRSQAVGITGSQRLKREERVLGALRLAVADDGVLVARHRWLTDSLTRRRLAPLLPYTLYQGRRTGMAEGDGGTSTVLASQPGKTQVAVEADAHEHKDPREQAEAILERARADTPPPIGTGTATRFISAPYGRRRFRDQAHGARFTAAPAAGRQRADSSSDETTAGSDATHDADADARDPPPGPVPDWVARKVKYACQRRSPAPCANEEFARLLQLVRRARALTGDEVGVRAYSTAVAAVRALPAAIRAAREVRRLPGCDAKMARLWREFRDTGTLAAAREVEGAGKEGDGGPGGELRILARFYEIWGVGERTARTFYYDKGWRDLDDLLEYGWDTLTRVQQIGLKFYDEFQLGIPRDEVEGIVATVKEHAARVRDGGGIEVLAVGGYRRGKELSGDVDVIVSHRELGKTANLVTDIVASLEDDCWITHTLRLDLTGTHRGQETLALRPHHATVIGSGFDTLDKAMVVWQDPHWPGKEVALAADPNAKNPNPHRRVDVIVSPWRTVGCAVLGWSGETTFQRDLRRYAKHVRGWKFDSSGVRDRRSGQVMALEGREGVAGSMVDAEKAVFEGMGLSYIEPSDRCTG